LKKRVKRLQEWVKNTVVNDPKEIQKMKNTIQITENVISEKESAGGVPSSKIPRGEALTPGHGISAFNLKNYRKYGKK